MDPAAELSFVLPFLSYSQSKMICSCSGLLSSHVFYFSPVSSKVLIDQTFDPLQHGPGLRLGPT